MIAIPTQLSVENVEIVIDQSERPEELVTEQHISLVFILVLAQLIPQQQQVDVLVGH